MKKHIPNLLTSMHAFSGCIACVMAFNGNYLWVVIWVIIASVFDFSDGFAARLLKASSTIGKDLDSLADMVSFGVAPALVVFRLLSDSPTINTLDCSIAEYIPYISFLLVIFSALRLAKFNNDERQSTSFIGLPTPANALFWISLCYGISERDEFIQTISFYPIIALIIVFSLLLTSEIPMFSLKVKSIKFKGNELRYLLILFMIIAISFWGLLGIAAGIILYIILSATTSKLLKQP
ncbi:CDP-diacylglycerol--serine O-phosphatidyltransferase [Dysgonomonas alginatilytica]|uniref:CDP-diacylglycerol--serine O-phosphatidyltransferase n=1 Tax=Dysgonomonas alginatilytica TaxID=1605892 RepID=A0A2V3PZH4_9BACT|nr:CDP-alcohol phosphatidyltransferase family protein [Dysgonomonas alginatilytica]PXV67541.1 CDP-diacylglycerol--serine O-phosphatidyltransferase [Dysgonomonas alginatilytica]